MSVSVLDLSPFQLWEVRVTSVDTGPESETCHNRCVRQLQAQFTSLIVNNAYSDETLPLQSALKAQNKIPKILCILADTYFIQTWFSKSGHNAILE